MTHNMSTADRMLRTVIVFIIAITLVTGVVTGLWAILLGIVGVVLLATVGLNTCPLYKLLGISTRRREPTA